MPVAGGFVLFAPPCVQPAFFPLDMGLGKRRDDGRNEMMIFYRRNTNHGRMAAVCALGYVLIAFPPPTLRAQTLQANDGGTNDKFGLSVAVKGNTALAGAYFHDTGGKSNQGAAYLFRDLHTADGTVTQSAKLVASDGARSDWFGSSVALSGGVALVGAHGDSNGNNNAQGSAYLFRNLSTANGTVLQSSKLMASDGAALDSFGTAVALSGDTAVVGAGSGASPAYLFRNLGTAPADITENARLIPSGNAGGRLTAGNVALSGNIALVAASFGKVGANIEQGAAYLFRGLDSASGVVSEEARLIASDGEARDRLGSSVALDGNRALVGAFHDYSGLNLDQGSAYLFRDLDTAPGTRGAPGTITEQAKLIASDGGANDNFGQSVALSGNIAIVGAFLDNIGARFDQGSAYLFTGLGANAAGVRTEHVKITASVGASFDYFGASVDIDGDRFVIGAYDAKDVAAVFTGKAFSGTVSSLTELDKGNSERIVSGISFVTREDWIIGKTTDGNTVTLSAGDTATVAVGGKAVFIGKEPGSDANKLEIAGTLVAGSMAIGAETGTEGNTLVLRATADITGLAQIIFGEGSKLTIEGDHTATGALIAKLGATNLRVRKGAALQTVTNANQDSLLAASFSGGFTTFSTPSADYAVWLETHAPTGAADEDFDGDGVENAAEYILGGTKDSNDLGKLPHVSETGGNFFFTFQRDQATTDATVRIEVGTTLATWPDTYAVRANTEIQQAGVTVVDNPDNPGFDTVKLTLAKAPDDRKFARLVVTP